MNPSAALVVFALISQPPAPGLGKGKGGPPQTQPQSAQRQPSTDPHGTEASPVVVKIQPTPKTDEETAKEKSKENRESSAYRWTLGLAIATGIVGLLQLVMIGVQARIAHRQNTIMETQSAIMRNQAAAAELQSRTIQEQATHMADGLSLTRDSLRVAQDSANSQTADMRASIAQATRTASAMENVAAALAVSVEATKESIRIMRGMAETNEAALRGDRGDQRGYLTLVGFEFGPRDPDGSPVAILRIQNTGQRAATITGRATILTLDETPPEDPSNVPWVWEPASAVAPPKQTIIMMVPFPDAGFTPDHWRKIHAGVLKVGVYGIFRYDSGFSEIPGETGFGFTYDYTDVGRKETERFSIADNPGYNYAK